MKFTRLLSAGLSFVLCFLNTNVYASDDLAVGESLYKSKGCIGCHGAAGKSANPSMFPVLAGNKADEIIEQLKAFKSYTRRNPMMNGMAAGLSEEEMTQIATYLAAQ